MGIGMGIGVCIGIGIGVSIYIYIYIYMNTYYENTRCLQVKQHWGNFTTIS